MPVVMTDQLSGTIERVTFHNPDNGFIVLRVEVRGQRGPVVIVGQTPRATPGEFVEATGKWVEDPEFGRQFKADTLRILPPSTVEGIEKYLGAKVGGSRGPCATSWCSCSRTAWAPRTHFASTRPTAIAPWTL
jgi:exodeoxyribonuclease V alpha subunit